jgi:hypothetical protein
MNKHLDFCRIYESPGYAAKRWKWRKKTFYSVPFMEKYWPSSKSFSFHADSACVLLILRLSAGIINALFASCYLIITFEPPTHHMSSNKNKGQKHNTFFLSYNMYSVHLPATLLARRGNPCLLHIEKRD